MAPGGRHVTRLNGNNKFQFDANVVDSQAVRGAATRVQGSPNTSNVGQLGKMCYLTSEGRPVSRMYANAQAPYAARMVDVQAAPDPTTDVLGSQSATAERMLRMNRFTEAPPDAGMANSQAPTQAEGSLNTTDSTPRVGHVQRRTRNNQAQPNSTTVNLQAPQDAATHVEGSSNTIVKKNIRKKTRNDFLSKQIKAMGRKPRIIIKEGMMQPVGPWSQSYVTEIGIIVRMHAPFHIHDWRTLSTKDKRTIFHAHILEKFDIDLHVEHVEKAVHRYMGIRFRNHRSRLHSYYMNLGGNEQYRRTKPASGVSQDNWVKLCTWFESDDFKKLSKKNSENRELQEVNHCAGTVSFVRFRENKRDSETDQEMGRIDLYHETHFSEKRGRWVGPTAQNNYDNMVMRHSQAAPEDSLPPTEDEICDNILSKRPGYTPGLGHGVMPTSSRQYRPSMEEIRRNNEETNRRLEEAERRANDAEMSRDELSLEMVNQARKIEELENWKAKLEQFMSTFELASTFPSGMNM